ncbi:hypothetical protein YEEN111655_03485 [Yersinia entomophaga]
MLEEKIEAMAIVNLKGEGQGRFLTLYSIDND